MNEKKNRRRGAANRAPAENCPQRILRRVLHEGNLGAMTPGEVYDATVDAVLQERKLTYQDLDDVARKMMRLDKRWELVSKKHSDMAIDIALRLDMEAGVLKWAMDEIKETLRPGNQYGGR